MKPKYNKKKSPNGLKWRCDLDRSVIVENMEERKWEESLDNNDWNFGWIQVHLIKKIFHPSSKVRLGDFQLVNHFPNHWELTRKDLLARNIKKFKKESEGELITLVNGKKMELSGSNLPETYIVPQEQSLFTEAFIKSNTKNWIFKPSGKSQGTGIQIINKISQVRALPSTVSSLRTQPGYSQEVFLVCRYIDNPFLLFGRKFDLRTYVLVTSYRPLKVWRYLGGFARVCFENYSSLDGQAPSKENDPNKNLFQHLTNVSFQKASALYNNVHGGKFPFASLLLHMELNYGKDKLNKLLFEMDRIYLSALKAVQPAMVQDKHCFELYGFDILIDSDLKPWLIEVNACPSLVSTTPADKRMKKKLFNNLINVVIPPNWLQSMNGGSSTCNEKKVDQFELLYDETLDLLSGKSVRPKSSVRRANSIAGNKNPVNPYC